MAILSAMDGEDLEFLLLEYWDCQMFYFDSPRAYDILQNLIDKYPLANFVFLINNNLASIEARVAAFFLLHIYDKPNNSVKRLELISPNICKCLLKEALFHIKNPPAWGWREPYLSNNIDLPLWLLVEFQQEIIIEVFYKLLEICQPLPFIPYLRGEFSSISPCRRNFAYYVFDYAANILSIATKIPLPFHEAYSERAKEIAIFKTKIQAYCAERGIRLE
jgi:hypothetical protein